MATIEQETLSSGIDGLDDILGGGYPSSRFCLVQGDPGVGKTTLGLQFLLDGAKRGERVLYVTLSETKEELQAVADSHGWSLDGIDLYELSAVQDLISAESVQTVYRSADVELNETTDKILDKVREIQPSRAVFDSLSELRLLARDALRYRRQIVALKQRFGDLKCTVLLLDDRTSEQADSQLQSLVHGVVLMEQHPPAYGVDRRQLRVQKMRGVRFRSGYHDFVIETGGLSVFPRLIPSEHRGTAMATPISSAIPALDQLMGGGIDRGVSTLLIGPAGVGKSSVAIQFAVAAAQRGERAAIYSFEESPRTMFMRARALGQNLEEFIRDGKIVYRQIDPAELPPGEFVQLVRREAEAGLSIVVIDSLNGFMNAMPEERFLVLQLHDLLAFLGQKSVATILVLAQHGAPGGPMSPPVEVSYLADTVLMFRFFEFGGEIKRAISTVKRRGGAHERAIRELYITGNGIEIGPALENFRGVLTGVPILEGHD